MFRTFMLNMQVKPSNFQYPSIFNDFFFLASGILLSSCNIENAMCWKIQASMKFQEKLIFKRRKYCASIKKQCRLSYIQLRESLIIESK